MKVLDRCRKLKAVGERHSVSVKNLWIKKTKVGLLIGNRGRTINRLQSEYNVRINNQHFTKNRYALFTLHGSTESIQAFQTGLTAVLCQWEYRVTDIPVVKETKPKPSSMTVSSGEECKIVHGDAKNTYSKMSKVGVELKRTSVQSTEVQKTHTEDLTSSDECATSRNEPDTEKRGIDMQNSEWNVVHSRRKKDCSKATKRE